MAQISELFSIKTSDGVTLKGERLKQTSAPSDAPVLVFSNSLGVSRKTWRVQASALSDSWDVVLYDTRGHGESDSPVGAYSLARLSLDVLDIFDGLEINKAHFCGLSLGGMTGQALAVRAPERLHSLTLAATSAYMGPPSAWHKRIETVLNKGMESISSGVRGKWFAPQNLTQEEIITDALAWFRGVNPVGYAGCCAAIRDMDLRPALTTISTPTLILAGKDDTATPPEHSAFLHKQIPHSTLTMLDGAHLLNLEQPTDFINALRDFLEVHQDD